ncbi:MAG: acyl-CoA thioesterase [Gemmataceae bacterium]|nr:acyl-CoA thioesterase [Gemmataceae bacterium]
MSHPLLVSFPSVVEFDVGWTDMDSFDHVSNLEYFRYFQEARLAYILRTGWLDLKRERGLGPILKSTSATYRKPLKYPDKVWVGARVSALGEDRVTFEHAVVSRAWDAVACEGLAVVVSYDYRSECKVALPDSVRRVFEEMEKAKG